MPLIFQRFSHCCTRIKAVYLWMKTSRWRLSYMSESVKIAVWTLNIMCDQLSAGCRKMRPVYMYSLSSIVTEDFIFVKPTSLYCGKHLFCKLNGKWFCQKSLITCICNIFIWNVNIIHHRKKMEIHISKFCSC